MPADAIINYPRGRAPGKEYDGTLVRQATEDPESFREKNAEMLKKIADELDLESKS